jgi:hypothetical protein
LGKEKPRSEPGLCRIIAVVCLTFTAGSIGLPVFHQSVPLQRLGNFGVLPHDIREIGILKGQGNLTGTESNLVAIYEAMLRFPDIVLVHEGTVLAPQVRDEISIAGIGYFSMPAGDRWVINNHVRVMVTAHGCGGLSYVYDDAVSGTTVYRQI